MLQSDPKTYIPDPVLVLVLEPVDDRPARGLHAYVLVVLDTALIIWVRFSVPRPSVVCKSARDSRARNSLHTHSLKYGSSIRIMLWIDTSTCSNVDVLVTKKKDRRWGVEVSVV